MHNLACAVSASGAIVALPPAWRVITKMAFFIGLIGTFGGGLGYLTVVGPISGRSSVHPADRAVTRRTVSVVLAGMGTWFLVALYFQLAGVVARGATPIPYGEALAPAKIWGYLTAPVQAGQWIATGAQTALQYGMWALAALVLVALWVPSVRLAVGVLAPVAAVVALVAWMVTAVPANLAKATPDSVADGLIVHMHVLAVSTWVGGIFVLALLGVTMRGRLTPAAGEMWAQMWTRFSKVALVAVGCVLLSGAWLAWKHLGSPSELFTTHFGRVLLVKISLVATMIVVGGVNELVLMPHIARARAAGEQGPVFRLAVRLFPRWVALEAVLALGVLLALSYLTGSGRAEAGDEPDPMATGTVVALGVALAVVMAISLGAASRVSATLSRPVAATVSGPAVPTWNG